MHIFPTIPRVELGHCDTGAQHLDDKSVRTGRLVFVAWRDLDARRTRRKKHMAIDGKWEITINSPMGAQKAKLDFQSNGEALTGTQHAQGASQPVNGKVDGNAVSWSANITSPMPMTLEFTGNVEGDALKGSVKAGAFGSFPFAGARV
jgi:hypothetical protein